MKNCPAPATDAREKGGFRARFFDPGRKCLRPGTETPSTRDASGRSGGGSTHVGSNIGYSNEGTVVGARWGLDHERKWGHSYSYGPTTSRSLPEPIAYIARGDREHLTGREPPSQRLAHTPLRGVCDIITITITVA